MLQLSGFGHVPAGPSFLSSIFTRARSRKTEKIPKYSHQLPHKIVIPKMGATGE
jgi:hypothetical protein